MDFYGFSGEVNEANAMQGSADLANAAYNNYNIAAQSNWRNDMIKAAQPAVDNAKKTLTDDTTREATEGGEQGGGTVAGTYGVYKTGMNIAETLSNQGKAIRIAEAQVKLATASGDVSEISRASEMLRTAKIGKMAEYAKAASRLADSKLGGKNIDAALELADKIRTGSTFNVATSALAGTKSGRAASKIIAEQAEKVKAAKAAAKQAAEDAGEGAEEVAGSAADVVAPAASSAATTLGEGIANVGSNFAANGGDLAGDVGDRLARAATAAIGQGTAATTSAVNTATTAVDSVAAPLADTAEQVAGAATDAAPAAVRAVGDLGGIARVANTVDNYNPLNLDTDDFSLFGDAGAGEGAFSQGTGADRISNTLSTLSNRGARTGGGFLSRFSRQIDLGSDTSDLPTGSLIDEGGTVAQKVNGFNAMAQAARPNPRTPTSIPEEPEEVGGGGGEEGGGDEVVRSPEPAAADRPPATDDEAREAQTDEQEAEQGGEASENAPAAVRGAEGADDLAVRAGTAAHEAEVAAHGFDSRALDAGGEALAAAAEGGGMATRAAASIGKTALSGIKLGAQGLKVAGPIMSAAFTIDQTKDEIESFASGKGFSGDGVQGKIGGVLQEVGDIAGTAAPILAAFGPLGDAAALGVEIGGGLLSLGGDLLGDWGTYDKEKAQRAKDQATKAAATKAQQAFSTSYNNAVQTAAAGGNVNLSGQGTIAQTAQSSVRAY
tara:strand:- start:19853 stop:22018 length:2166 start_codon:yes stop_codon:yes gene_type:complete